MRTIRSCTDVITDVIAVRASPAVHWKGSHELETGLAERAEENHAGHCWPAVSSVFSLWVLAMTAPKTAREYAEDAYSSVRGVLIDVPNLTETAARNTYEHITAQIIEAAMSAARAEGFAAGRAEALEEAAQEVERAAEVCLRNGLAESHQFCRAVTEVILALATKREGK